MSDRQSFFKIHTVTLPKNRKIIGLDINKGEPYSYYKSVKTEATIDSFKEIQRLCSLQWNDCVNDEICNKVLDISQKYSSGSNVTKEEEIFISSNKDNPKITKIAECSAEIEKSKQQTAEQANQSITNLNDQVVINTSPVNIYDKLFSNNEEYQLFATDFKFRLVKINETNDIISFKQLIDKGLVSINILDQNYNTDTKLVISGGIYDNKTFFNRETYMTLFTSLDNFRSNQYPYYKENSFNILGTEDRLTINELFTKGMTDFTIPSSEVWNQDSVFKIIGGEYDGKFIKNKINEYIEKSLLCNYISKIPFLGEKLCGSNDYSLYFVIFIGLILLLILFFFIFRKKKSKPKVIKKQPQLSPDQLLAIKKAKVLQMEFNE